MNADQKKPGLTLLLVFMSCDPAFLTGYAVRYLRWIFRISEKI